MKKLSLLLTGYLSTIAVFAEEAAIVSTRDGLSIKSVDGSYSAKLGGRIQYDYNRAEKNAIADEDDFGIRRARLSVAATTGDFSYRVQFNIGTDNAGSAADLYIRYQGFGKRAKITLGRQKMPFGLEQLTSSKDISLLERSAITERYSLGRQDGIQLNGSVDNISYALALFEDGSADDDDFGMAARATWSPIHNDYSVLHFGTAYTERGNHVSALGLEAAYSFKSLHLQGEYVSADETGTAVDGYYLQIGWLLTSQTRPYKAGAFKRIKGSGGIGAWELVARYEDGNGSYSDIELGTTDARAIGLGLNWYYNSNVRVGINYTFGEDNSSDDEGNELRIRTQFTF